MWRDSIGSLGNWPNVETAKEKVSNAVWDEIGSGNTDP